MTTPHPHPPSPRTIRFWDKIADRYARKPVPDESVYQRKLALTRQYLQPHMEVFEFGCGTGSTALAHAPHVKRILATDVSHRMIEIAEDKARNANIRNVTFKRGAVEDLKQPAESLDAVLGMSILHLVEDWQAVVSDVYGMLKPGGVFVSSTVCLRDMSLLYRLALPMIRLVGIAPLVKVFGADELVRAMMDAGFQIEQRWLPGKNNALFLIARKPL